MNEKKLSKLSIKSWSDDDQPREKLCKHGARSLSNSELIAIILRSGNRQYNAKDLAQSILNQCQDKLHHLSKKNYTELQQLGLGKVASITLEAVFELQRRMNVNETSSLKIETSEDYYQFIKPSIQHLKHEELWVTYLSNQNTIIHNYCHSKGGITQSIADIRLILKEALLHNAVKILVAHNHPSGLLKASEADITLTQKLKEACKTINISLLDHLIISEEGFIRIEI